MGVGGVISKSGLRCRTSILDVLLAVPWWNTGYGAKNSPYLDSTIRVYLGMCLYSLELAYVFKYPVKKKLHDQTIWVIRQAGVYNKQNMESGANTWLFILPNRESVSTEAITNIVHAGKHHPLMSHVETHFRHLTQWRWYMVDCEESFHESVRVFIHFWRSKKAKLNDRRARS